MHISLNGEARQLPPGTTVSGLLEILELLGKRVAIERNGEIVPKGLHATTALAEGDALEIVVAVGGG
ncbi:sulfur carrier protein ThiS [Uliginosibacterium flavum]